MNMKNMNNKDVVIVPIAELRELANGEFNADDYVCDQLKGDPRAAVIVMKDEYDRLVNNKNNLDSK